MLLRCSWGPLKKITGFNPENARDPIQNIDTGSVKVTLKRADVRAIDLGTMRELFLRDASHPPKLS